MQLLLHAITRLLQPILLKQKQAPTKTLEGKDYVIDSDSSTVFWKGSKPTGDIHVGTVQIKKGILKISDGTITGGQFTIDMNSILVTDEDMSEKGKK